MRVHETRALPHPLRVVFRLWRTANGSTRRPRYNARLSAIQSSAHLKSGKPRKRQQSRHSRVYGDATAPAAPPAPASVDSDAADVPIPLEFGRHETAAADGRIPTRCPVCGGPVARKRRRFLDRLRSLAGTVHRYRCIGINCRWEGVLPVRARRRSHRS